MPSELRASQPEFAVFILVPGLLDSLLIALEVQVSVEQLTVSLVGMRIIPKPCLLAGVHAGPKPLD